MKYVSILKTYKKYVGKNIILKTFILQTRKKQKHIHIKKYIFNMISNQH